MKQPMRKPDKFTLREVARSIVYLGMDQSGQMSNAKSVDHVMEDILGQRRFLEHLINCRNDYEVMIAINGADLDAFISVFTDQSTLGAFVNLIDIQKDMKKLRRNIKKEIKKGHKPEKLKKRLNRLEKIYNKGVKAFKNLLGIKKEDKSKNPKDKYRNIIELNDRLDTYGGLGYTYFFNDDDDDYEDEEFVPGEDTYQVLGKRPVYHSPAYRAPKSGTNIPYDDWDDDDDEEDDDDDDDSVLEERLDNLMSAMEENNDKLTKIMSGIGRVISVNDTQSTGVTGSTEYPAPTPAYSNTGYGSFNNEVEALNRLDVVEERMDIIKDAINRIFEIIEPDDENDESEFKEAADVLDKVMTDATSEESEASTKLPPISPIENVDIEIKVDVPENQTTEVSEENTEANEIPAENMTRPELIDKVNTDKSKPSNSQSVQKKSQSQSKKNGSKK